MASRQHHPYASEDRSSIELITMDELERLAEEYGVVRIGNIEVTTRTSRMIRRSFLTLRAGPDGLQINASHWWNLLIGGCLLYLPAITVFLALDRFGRASFNGSVTVTRMLLSLGMGMLALATVGFVTEVRWRWRNRARQRRWEGARQDPFSAELIERIRGRLSSLLQSQGEDDHADRPAQSAT